MRTFVAFTALAAFICLGLATMAAPNHTSGASQRADRNRTTVDLYR